MRQILQICNYLFLMLFVYVNQCETNEIYARGGRARRTAYTSTVLETKFVTSIVPSSCVQVEATLPPCRNVRYLKFPKMPWSINKNNQMQEEVVTNWRTEPQIETTSLSWGEYFGIFAPTVTITSTDLHVTTVEDPSVVVTYAVKGCRPLKLPMDLNRCPQEPTSLISIEEILTTSTVAAPVVATETLLPTKTMSTLNPTLAFFENMSNFEEETPNTQDDFNLLEPSVNDMGSNVNSEPTETL